MADIPIRATHSSFTYKTEPRGTSTHVMFYKYKHLEASSTKYDIKEELCSTPGVTVEMLDSIMKCWRFFFPFFCSLKLDVLHMIWSLCGSCSKYLAASRKQEPATQDWYDWALTWATRMSVSMFCLIKLFNTEAPSNSNTGFQNNSGKSGECLTRTEVSSTFMLLM